MYLALKGRDIWTYYHQYSYISPFQGLSIFSSVPRALPWASISSPFRAKTFSDWVYLAFVPPFFF